MMASFLFPPLFDYLLKCCRFLSCCVWCSTAESSLWSLWGFNLGRFAVGVRAQVSELYVLSIDNGLENLSDCFVDCCAPDFHSTTNKIRPKS